jgi:hypothetical protein
MPLEGETVSRLGLDFVALLAAEVCIGRSMAFSGWVGPRDNLCRISLMIYYLRVDRAAKFLLWSVLMRLDPAPPERARLDPSDSKLVRTTRQFNKKSSQTYNLHEQEWTRPIPAVERRIS